LWDTRRDILAEQREGGEKSLGEWVRQVCICCGYWMSKQRPDVQKNMKVGRSEELAASSQEAASPGTSHSIHVDSIDLGWRRFQRMSRHARQVFADVAEEIVGALNALIFKYGVNCILDLDFIVSTAFRVHLLSGNRQGYK
jgi:hypothetical protein